MVDKVFSRRLDNLKIYLRKTLHVGIHLKLSSWNDAITTKTRAIVDSIPFILWGPFVHGLAARKRHMKRLRYVMHCFQQLESIDQDTKRRLRNLVCNKVNVYIAATYWAMRTAFVLLICPLLLIFSVDIILHCISFAASGVPVLMLPPPQEIPQKILVDLPLSINAVAGLLIGTALAFVTLELPRRLIHKRPFFAREMWITIWSTVVAMISIAFIYSLKPSLSPMKLGNLTNNFSAGFVSAFLSLSLIYIFRGVPHFLYQLLLRRVMAMCPDAVIVYTLLDMLYVLDIRIHPETWSKSWFRQYLIHDLEQVSYCLEHYIPKLLKSGDAQTDQWTRQMTREAAFAMRDLKKWVILPRSDTKSQLTIRVTDAFICVAAGNWDDLGRTNYQSASISEVWHTRIISAIRVIIVSGLPWLVLLILQRTPLALTDPVETYVKIGALVWTLLSFIAALDPLFSTKISALKDITSLLPTAGEKSRIP
jgi:hypothetical protein